MWLCATVIAISAGILDWRSRRIPNWLTMSALVAGLAAKIATAGITGGLESIEGTSAALIVLLPVVFLRGLGGGDWKLMGALGAWLGPGQTLMILLVTISLSGLLALVQIIRAKRFVATIRNVWELLRGFFVFGFRPHPEINLDNPAALTLPFGSAAALATMACFWIGWRGL